MPSSAEQQAELDAQIRSGENDLVQLKRRRNSLSPISGLPPELLSEIFIASIPTTSYAQREGRMMPHGMVLGQVSHLWRAILKPPEVWAHFQVGVRTKAAVLDVAFDRTRNASTSVNLCGWEEGGHPSKPSAETTAVLRRIICDPSARCRFLELCIHEETLRSIIDGLQATFGGLLALEMDFIGTNRSRAPPAEFLNSSFPVLRRLDLSPRTVIPLRCNLLQSAHLTHVNIGSVRATTTTILDLVEFLDRSTNLISFGIGAIRSRPGGELYDLSTLRRDNPTHLSNLENFGLCGLSSGVLSRLLLVIRVTPSCSFKASCLYPLTGLMKAVSGTVGNLEPTGMYISSTLVETWDASLFDATVRSISPNGIKPYSRLFFT